MEARLDLKRAYVVLCGSLT